MGMMGRGIVEKAMEKKEKMKEEWEVRKFKARAKRMRITKRRKEEYGKVTEDQSMWRRRIDRGGSGRCERRKRRKFRGE